MTEPLPEVQAALEAKEDNRRANRKVVRNLTAIGVVVGLVIVGSQVWNDHETGLIRQTQIENTQAQAHNTAVAECLARDSNIIGQDVTRLLSGDKNQADYPRPKLCN